MKRVVITGGAGFVGSNLADYLLRQGSHVAVFDNVSRKGTERNLAWLREQHGERVRVVDGDIRDVEAVARCVKGAEVVYHLAAQVAVTTSIVNPRLDFEINALGTLNVLEAARCQEQSPIVALTSTNKVYGKMANVAVVEEATRYRYADLPLGVSEGQPLDFFSPYGCAKGAADQYVLDYARIYGVPTVVFRCSCIYGPRQFGNEDQGWVAHFALSCLRGQPLTIYGDGKQVRDVLFVGDLVRAFDLATQQIERARGQAYNIGGGPESTVSLLELLDFLRERLGRTPAVSFGEWRAGDQKVYISDTRKARRDLGWQPTVSWQEGVERLLTWLRTV